MSEDKFKDVIEKIKQSSPESSIYVGCDSICYNRGGRKRKGKSEWYARYSTVVILHRDSCRGGEMIYHHSESLKDYGNKKTRLLQEVQFIVEVALAIVDHIEDRHMELHIDINPDPKHASFVAYNEAKGWIKGMGFEAKFKPESWASTHAADHAVRYKH